MMCMLVLPCGSVFSTVMFSPPLLVSFGVDVCIFRGYSCLRFCIVVCGRSSLLGRLLLSMCGLFQSCGGTLLSPLHARSISEGVRAKGSPSWVLFSYVSSVLHRVASWYPIRVSRNRRFGL
jgi:hypothetical protein